MKEDWESALDSSRRADTICLVASWEHEGLEQIQGSEIYDKTEISLTTSQQQQQMPNCQVSLKCPLNRTSDYSPIHVESKRPWELTVKRHHHQAQPHCGWWKMMLLSLKRHKNHKKVSKEDKSKVNHLKKPTTPFICGSPAEMLLGN